MTPIQWKDIPDKSSRSARDDDPAGAAQSSLWFGVALCLMGVIGGYFLASAL